jgi:tetratricopeptide (TPR) repeat protein
MTTQREDQPEESSRIPDPQAALAEAERLLAADDAGAARQCLEQLVARSEETGDRASEAAALRALGQLEWARAHGPRALPLLESAWAIFHELRDRAAEGDTLLTIADCQRTLGRTGQADESYRAAAALYESSDDRLGQAHTAFKLADLLAEQAPEVAREALTRAAALYEEHDRQSASGALRIGDATLPDRVGDCRRIEPWIMAKIARRELVRLERGGDPAPAQSPTEDEAPAEIITPSPGWRDLTIAAAAAIKSKTSARSLLVAVGLVVCAGAALFFNAPMAITREASPADQVSAPPKAGDAPPDAAAAEAGLGGRLPAAAMLPGADVRAAHGRTLAEYEAAGDRQGQADTLRAYAEFEDSLQRRERALELYGRSAALYRELGATLPAAQVTALMGDILFAQKQFAAAQLRYSEADILYHQLDNPGARGRTLRKLGDVERALGRPDGARAAYLQAIDLAQQRDDSGDHLALLLRLGHLERDVGAPDRARESYIEAFVFSEQRGDAAGQARAALAVARLEAARGSADAARTAFQHAIKFAAIARAYELQGLAWRLRGDFERAGARLDMARESYAGALRVARERELRRDEARALARIASLEAQRGYGDAARTRFTQVIALYEHVGDPIGRARAEIGAGDLDVKLERPTDARAAFERALAIYEQSGDTDGQIAALERLTRVTGSTDKDAAAAYEARAAALRARVQS